MRNTTTQHTPGPWHYVLDGFRLTIGNVKTSHTTTPHDYLVAEIPDNSMQAEANAAFIVRACNCHDELVEALKSLFEHCAMVHNKWGDDCNNQQADAAIAAARAAIAKAQGR